MRRKFRLLCGMAFLLGTPTVIRAETVGEAAAELVAVPEGMGDVLRAAEILRLALGMPTLQRASVTSGGTQLPGSSHGGATSSDARIVAFGSGACTTPPVLCASVPFAHDFETNATEQLDIGLDGGFPNGTGAPSALSADGRFVAFSSIASNLVPDDTNGAGDIFVYDRMEGITERVSVSTEGDEGEFLSQRPTISADGRFVAFDSDATTLVPDDTNGSRDVFVRDRQFGVTERVSISPEGVQGDDGSGLPVLSADGRFVAFNSSASNLIPGFVNTESRVVVHDRVTGVTELVSVASDGTPSNDSGFALAISADGRFVAFESEATNLVSEDTNERQDVFVRDRLGGVTERVSVDSNGAQGLRPSYLAGLSADGRFVALLSAAENFYPPGAAPAFPTLILQVFVHDRETGQTRIVSANALGEPGNDHSDRNLNQNTMSADSRFVAFDSEARNLVPGDTNDRSDVFRAPNPLFWDAPAPVPPPDVN